MYRTSLKWHKAERGLSSELKTEDIENVWQPMMMKMLWPASQEIAILVWALPYNTPNTIISSCPLFVWKTAIVYHHGYVQFNHLENYNLCKGPSVGKWTKQGLIQIELYFNVETLHTGKIIWINQDMVHAKVLLHWEKWASCAVCPWGTVLKKKNGAHFRKKALKQLPYGKVPPPKGHTNSLSPKDQVLGRFVIRILHLLFLDKLICKCVFPGCLI